MKCFLEQLVSCFLKVSAVTTYIGMLEIPISRPHSRPIKSTPLGTIYKSVLLKLPRGFQCSAIVRITENPQPVCSEEAIRVPEPRLGRNGATTSLQLMALPPPVCPSHTGTILKAASLSVGNRSLVYMR